jgi:hypothetical protein
MTVSQNLSLAHSAMHYATTKLTFGSSNKFFDNLKTLGITALAVREMYKQTDQYLKAGNVPIPTPGHADWNTFGLQFIDAMSQAALTMGAGNCEENAAIAFMYLYNRGVRPLDYMMISNRHAFVVLGAEVRPMRTNFTEWTSGAAVACDPWYRRSEIAGMLAPHFPHDIARMSSAFRVE